MTTVLNDGRLMAAYAKSVVAEVRAGSKGLA